MQLSTALGWAPARAKAPIGPALRYLVAVAAVLLLTLLIARLQDRVGASHLQMSYLLVVLALAITSGRGPTILASFLAFLVFDWFFVRPVGNLLVADPDEWFALGLFLVVGISTGGLAAGLKKSAAEARQRSSETTTLLELSTDLLAGPSLEPVLRGVVERLETTLRLAVTAVRLLGPDGTLALVVSAGTDADSLRLVTGDPSPQVALTVGQPGTHAERLLAPDGTARALLGFHVPLRLNGRDLGVLSAYAATAAPALPEHDARLVQAFAVQTALAVGRVRLIEEEERARAAAESDRMKSVFLASISHDLRTPITTIKTAAAFVLAEGEAEPVVDATRVIDREADRLNHFVGNLLEISRIEAEESAPPLGLEDLTELVGAAAHRTTPLLGNRRLRVSASPDPILVRGDGPQIGRVLTNLLENAIKFSPDATVISIALSSSDQSALLRVHNHGPSIPADEQQRVFDKFYRLLARDGEVTGGAGLGLAVCKGIVQAHQGRVWTWNEDGGVAFYVSLPTVMPDGDPP